MVRAGRQGRDTAGEIASKKAPADRKTSRGAGDKSERQAQRVARRTELVEAALKVIRRDGPGASMDRMAAEAGVTKPILYRHFQDRGGLVAAIGECAFNQVSVGLDKALHADVTPRQMVLSTIDAYLQFIESDQDVYRFLVHRTSNEGTDSGAMLNEYIARAGSQVAMVLGEGLRAAGLDSGPAEPWAFGIVGMVHSAGDWWMDRATMPRIRLAEYLTSLIYDGLPNAGSLGTAGTWLPGAGGDAPDTVLPPDSSSMTHTPADIEPDPAEGVVTPLAPKRRRSP